LNLKFGNSILFTSQLLPRMSTSSNQSLFPLLFPPPPPLQRQNALPPYSPSAVQDDLLAIESLLNNLQDPLSSSGSSNNLPASTISASQAPLQPKSRTSARCSQQRAATTSRQRRAAPPPPCSQSLQLPLPPAAALTAITSLPTQNSQSSASQAMLPISFSANVEDYVQYLFDSRLVFALNDSLSSVNDVEREVYLLVYKHYLSLFTAQHLAQYSIDYNQSSLNDVCVICVDILKASSLFPLLTSHLSNAAI
jgi:hypothetical protein